MYLTEEGHIRDANDEAVALFPALADAVGKPLAAAVPVVADHLDRDAVIEREWDDETKYFRVSSTPFSFGGTRVGRMVVLTDVTREEQYRREIERQNERLGKFASVVSHDLRNPLNVAQGRLDLERKERDSENLAATSRALHRMEDLVADVLLLAREGLDIAERTTVSLSSVADSAWESVNAANATLTVVDDVQFSADEDRILQLFENLYRNSVEHAGPEVTIRVGALEDAGGFYVEDDGTGVPEVEREDVFEMGYSPSGGTGIGLAIVETMRKHTAGTLPSPTPSTTRRSPAARASRFPTSNSPGPSRSGPQPGSWPQRCPCYRARLILLAADTPVWPKR